jgi:DNA-binding transcriptional MerR regulator
VTIERSKIRELLETWQNESEKIELVQQRLKELRNEVDEIEDIEDHEESWRYKELIVSCIGDTYRGLERTLKRIVSTLDEIDVKTLNPNDINIEPDGNEDYGWHKLLVEKAREVTSTREAILSDDGVSAARNLIKFRHFDRKNYPQEKDWKEIRKALESYDGFYLDLFKEIEDFLSNLEDNIKVKIRDRPGSADSFSP